MAMLSLEPGGNSLISATLNRYGIRADTDFPWILIVNASLQNNGTALECTSFEDKAALSPKVWITVFGIHK